MGNCSYRLLQVTNASLGPIGVGSLIPFGVMTRQVKRSSSCTPTFELTTSVNNSLYINEAGFYKINYQAYVTVAAAGNVVLQLQLNGVTVQTATVTVPGAGTFLVSLTFITRVLNNCCSNVTNIPMLMQILNSGIALTGGTSNLIVERVNSGS